MKWNQSTMLSLKIVWKFQKMVSMKKKFEGSNESLSWLNQMGRSEHGIKKKIIVLPPGRLKNYVDSYGPVNLDFKIPSSRVKIWPYP